MKHQSLDWQYVHLISNKMLHAKYVGSTEMCDSHTLNN